MISYEIAMGMSIIALILTTGSLSLNDIVQQQHGMNWNIFYQPLGFLIFIICAFAETNRAPFDLPECETELIGGYHTEYSSMKLGFYLFAEYINMFISSAVIATLYFGGYNMPFYRSVGIIAKSGDYVWFTVFLYEDIIPDLSIYVDQMDITTIQVRPADESGLEKTDAIGYFQHYGYRCLLLFHRIHLIRNAMQALTNRSKNGFK